MNKRTFADRDALDAQLTEDVTALLERAVAERGEAVLVVSGGSTPIGFFQRLSRCTLPWERITVTLADDRWVSADHADSNEKLVREKLLVNNAVAARFVSLTTADGSPEAGQDTVEERLAGLGEFDVVILGMGGDGHTASLFPQAVALAEGLDMDSGKNCIAVDPVTAPHPRISLTLPRLLRARQVFIHITGDEKRRVLEAALALKGSEAQRQLPISTVLNQGRVPVTLYWSA